MSGAILVERDAAIATVVLNNPEKLSALSFGMWIRLPREMLQRNADPFVSAPAAA